MFHYDIYFFILVVPAMIFAFVCQFKVKSTYKTMSKIPNSRGITGAYAAQAILSYYGINDVSIKPISGSLTDNYNPTNKVISLSEGVYNSTSVAAIGIACHEAGHAAQHAQNYLPNQIRSSLVPVCNIGSKIGLPIAILGYLLAMRSSVMDSFGELLVYIGLGLYGLILVFSLVTLPVEFNASHRALKVITETGLLEGEQIGKARSVLAAAAMTYVASMITALANLLRFALIFLGNNRKNN